MRTYLLAVALLASCVQHDDPGSGAPASGGAGGKADSAYPVTTGPVRYVDRTFEQQTYELECAAAQGNMMVGMLSPQSFSASAMLAAIKAEDVERGCPGRTYSTSRANAVATFQNFAANEDSFKQELQDRCAAYGTDTATLMTGIQAAIADPANIAVYSSVHDTAGDDDPVGCFYYRFYIVRANGTTARWYFDWSD